MGEEFRGQSLFLPFVPYALSLSLRVSYRDLRLTRVPLFRERSRKQLLQACGVLREYGEVYSSALALVEMVEQTLREMDKAYYSILNPQNPPNNATPGRSDNALGADAYATASLHSAVSGNQCDYGQGSETYSTTRRQILPDSRLEVAQSPNQYSENSLNPSMLDNIPSDIDIFSHFDPNFNLPAIDAVLGNNVNEFPTHILD